MSKVSVLPKQFRQAFLSAWEEVYQGERREYLEYLYRMSDKEWTVLMCGRKPRVLDKKSLIERTLEKLNEMKIGCTLAFDPERQDMDVYGRVIHEPHKEHTDGINMVAIEVENSTGKSYEEFWKLVHSRCPLKVLVTYLPPGSSVLNTVLDKMQVIYERARAVIGPDRPDSYLLVVGTRKRKEAPKEILWEFYGLGPQGRFTEKIG